MPTEKHLVIVLNCVSGHSRGRLGGLSDVQKLSFETVNATVFKHETLSWGGFGNGAPSGGQPAGTSESNTRTAAPAPRHTCAHKKSKESHPPISPIAGH